MHDLPSKYSQPTQIACRAATSSSVQRGAPAAICFAADDAKLPTFSKNDGPVIGCDTAIADLAERYCSTSLALSDSDNWEIWWIALWLAVFASEVLDILHISKGYRITGSTRTREPSAVVR